MRSGGPGLVSRLRRLAGESGAGEAMVVVDEGPSHRLSAGARLSGGGPPAYFVEVVLGSRNGNSEGLGPLQAVLEAARRLEASGLRPLHQEEGSLVYELPVPAGELKPALKRMRRLLRPPGRPG